MQWKTDLNEEKCKSHNVYSVNLLKKRFSFLYRNIDEYVTVTNMKIVVFITAENTADPRFSTSLRKFNRCEDKMQPCDNSFNDEACKELCIDAFFGKNPVGACKNYGTIKGIICTCTSDCP